MSIADDPAQWTRKPKDTTMDVYSRSHTLADYHKLREALWDILQTTPLPHVKGICTKALAHTPRDGCDAV